MHTKYHLQYKNIYFSCNILKYIIFVCTAFLSDEDLLVVQKLKELTEQHRCQLIIKDKELLEKANEIEKVNITHKLLVKKIYII